jgi:hypothetical protein
MALPNVIHNIGRIRKLQVRIRWRTCVHYELKWANFRETHNKKQFFNISYTYLQPKPKKGAET